jgi:hypothetical protein
MSQKYGDLLGSSRITSSKFRLILIGLLFLVVSLPLTTQLATYASSGASMSMSYTLKTSAPNKIFVTISATDSQLPSSVTVNLHSYYKGATSAFNVQSVVLSPSNGGSVTVTFVVPFQGGGNYLFVGSIVGPLGKVWMKTSIDPHIEPEW